MVKNKKNIIILLLIVIIFILLGIVILFIFNKSSLKIIDASSFSTNELLKLFSDEGYEIRITDIDGTIYISLQNNSKGISIQRIHNTYLGKFMTFDNSNINSEMADLLNPSENDTIQKQQQYQAFESWLKQYNVTIVQLSNMLDNYYSKNTDKIEIINLNELLTID